MADAIRTCAEFWPFYLQQHSRRATRVLHYVATATFIISVGGAVLAADATFIPAGIILAYGLAWFSHFVFEGNKPATFAHPVWSLRSDFRMLGMLLTGRLGGPLAIYVEAPHGLGRDRATESPWTDMIEAGSDHIKRRRSKRRTRQAGPRA